MSSVFNLFSKLRGFIYTNRFYYIKKYTIYYLRNKLGKFRSFWHIVFGKIIYDKKFRTLVIGWKTKLNLEPKAKIILLGIENFPHKNYINNKIFPYATTIGTRAYFYTLDPPCYSETKIELAINAKLIMASNTFIASGCYVTGGQNSVIEIGENTYISFHTKINCKGNLKIGRNCLIGQSVSIMDYDGHMVYDASELEKKYQDSGKIKSVTIGDNVWIGFGASILKGVNIGSGAIISAGSVVASDVPDNTLVAGNLARIGMKNIIWER